MPSKHKERRRYEMRRSQSPPKAGTRDLPALPVSTPTTSREPLPSLLSERGKESGRRKCLKYLYNRENKTFCERTCKNWLAIIFYSLIYIIFLCTYTLIFLYGSLTILKMTTDYQTLDKTELLTYAENGIGLTAIPTSENNNYPLIWYRNGKTEDYQKYIGALDKVLQKSRRKREVNNTDLGPCSIPPYGFGDKPCILVKINKQLRWSVKPLVSDSELAVIAPAEVKKWLTTNKKKLWLHCSGYHSYDKEHIGHIKYYPDPPGFDPDIFPLDVQSKSPLVAVQISNFTLGISLAIECKLWYENGPSSVEFMLYVAPDVYIKSQLKS
ncbi:sodium/potassium-transporting ATPase subunit beta-1 [Aphomia sociella]